MRVRAFLLLCALPLVAAAAPRGFDARDLVALDRASAPTLSADGAQLVFAVRQADVQANKAVTGLWYRNLLARDAGPPQRLTPEGWNVNSPAFSPDGRTVYFLSAQSGSQQLWSMPAKPGAAPVQVTDYPLDVGSFKLSPDGRQVALSIEVFADCGADLACTKQRLDDKAADKASGVLYERLFVRHWDTWADGRRSQLFAAGLDAQGKAGAPRLLSRGIDGDIPSKPFGDASEYAWAPDGAAVAFSARIAGKTEAWSTDFDLFRATLADESAPVNLTEDNPAWDTGPVFSADGQTLYYRAMRRPGFEADRFALMALDLTSGARREIAPHFDRSAEGIVLAPDGKTIFTTASDLGEQPLFAVDIATGRAERIVGGGHIGGFDLAGRTLAFVRDDLAAPAEVFTAALDGSSVRRIGTLNQARLAEVAFGEFEQFHFAGWKDETVYGYVVKPWNYKKGEKYPVAFIIHGGPQGSMGNMFHYRWNPQTYAGKGYAVVFIDFHGSTGYGQAFTDSISGHWGDRPLEDLRKGWAAALSNYPFLDGERACALGASYGGYMINWIAGNWPEPWKCLVNHDGVFDNRMMGYATEELWFTEWENGGTPFEAAEGYERFNPVNHIAHWQVPMLVVQGELDHRIPVSQGLATFTALQRRGIPSQLLYFPDENHWVLKPQNSVRWHETVMAWLDRWAGSK